MDDKNTLKPAILKMRPNQCPGCFTNEAIVISYNGRNEILIENYDHIEESIRARLFNCRCKKCGETFGIDWVSINNKLVPYPIDKKIMIRDARMKIINASV